MIISGVNRGSNSGRDVLYSGTVGGIIEGAYNDLPGIAFSFSDFELPPLSVTKRYFFPLISHFLAHPLPQGSFLNVNFPLNSKNGINGFKLTKQGRSRWLESPDRRTHPQGNSYYWLGGKWLTHEEEDPESDVAWLEKGYVSGAPIHVGELTDRTVLNSHKERAEGHINLSIDGSPRSEPLQ
jgi:5'-nucleotidase